MSADTATRLLNKLGFLRFQLDGIKFRIWESSENPALYTPQDKIGFLSAFEDTLQKLLSTVAKIRNTAMLDKNLIDYLNSIEDYVEMEQANLNSLKEKHSGATRH